MSVAAALLPSSAPPPSAVSCAARRHHHPCHRRCPCAAAVAADAVLRGRHAVPPQPGGAAVHCAQALSPAREGRCLPAWRLFLPLGGGRGLFGPLPNCHLHRSTATDPPTKITRPTKLLQDQPTFLPRQTVAKIQQLKWTEKRCLAVVACWGVKSEWELFCLIQLQNSIKLDATL